MIAFATVEVSHHVVRAETNLPLTVDGQLLRVGVGVRLRNAQDEQKLGIAAFKHVVEHSVLHLAVGDFVLDTEVYKLPTPTSFGIPVVRPVTLDMPRVRRGDVVHLAIECATPPECPVVLIVLVEIAEDARPVLN